MSKRHTVHENALNVESRMNFIEVNLNSTE